MWPKARKKGCTTQFPVSNEEETWEGRGRGEIQRQAERQIFAVCLFIFDETSGKKLTLDKN